MFFWRKKAKVLPKDNAVTLKSFLTDRLDKSEAFIFQFSSKVAPNGYEIPLFFTIFYSRLHRLRYVIPSDYLHLRGVVSQEGSWIWNGKDSPADSKGNPLFHIKVYLSEEQWEKLTNKFSR